MRAYDVRPPSLPCPPSPRCVEKVFNMTRRGCTLLVMLCGDGGASLRCLHVIAGASREVCDVARRENPPRHVVSPVSKSKLVSINSNEKKRMRTLYALLVHSHAPPSTIALRSCWCVSNTFLQCCRWRQRLHEGSRGCQRWCRDWW